MTKAEVLRDESPQEWEPVLTLRPHHLAFNIYNRTAIGKGLRPPIMPLVKPMAVLLYPFFRLITKKDRSGYFQDLDGDTLQQFTRRIGSVISFQKELEKLKDNDVIHLDIKPDPICNSCVIGRHCTATNYMSRGGKSSIDTMKGEIYSLMLIYEALTKNDCKEGEDFIFKKASHILTDFRGQDLRAQENLEEVSVEFSSLLVKAGALRKIAYTL